MDFAWWPAATAGTFDGRWQPFPGVWLLVLVVGGLLLRSQRGSSGLGAPRGHARLFAIAGCLSLWLSLDWPVGPLAAGQLLSVRAAQYLVLTFVTAPLCLLGLSPTRGPAPETVIAGGPMHAVSHPFVAVPVFALVLAITHVAPVVDTLAAHEAGVLLVNVAWLAVAVIFWWRLIGPEPDARRMPYLATLVYLVVPFMLTKVPGLVFAFHEQPLFDTYAHTESTLGVSAGVDQQLAGFVLWFVGSVMVVTAIAVLFFRWQAEDRRMGGTDNLALPADARAIALLFAVPGAWQTLEAVVATLRDALPAGTHGAELAFDYRELPRSSDGTQVVLELRIALDTEAERALSMLMQRVLSAQLARLAPDARAAVSRRFSFRVVTYGSRVG